MTHGEFRAMCLRYILPEVRALLESGQTLILWDSDGIFMMAIEDKMTAYCFKQVDATMQRKAKMYMHTVSFGNQSEEVAKKNLDKYLLYRQRTTRSMAWLARRIFKRRKDENRWYRYWVKEDIRIFGRVSTHTLKYKSFA